MKKIVITGGPHSGKTTVIEYFSKLGFKIVSESAIELIDKLNKEFGIDGQKKWRMKNQAEFQIMVAKKASKKESKLKIKADDIIFFDRSAYDTIAYCRLRNIQVPKEILNIIKKHKYNKVFVLETLSNFKQRSKTGRTSDKKTSIKTNKIIEDVYKEYGMKVIRVKEMSIIKRIDFIKKYLEL